MAILRNHEIWEMDIEELDDRLFQLREDLMKIKGVLASGGIPEDIGRAREIKRTIARILTIKNIKQKEQKEKQGNELSKVRTS
ncbi:MAG: 50S ribosomal protein L29 [Candidatus Altiarchaeales archaeon]|nr:MAG: 50S ribosomal protein L29 [Candidatus Altiarchaeales archaeon]HDI72728.1 50S ribosomal protein L29 [Candidatus Altiarchaeales archaeon]